MIVARNRTLDDAVALSAAAVLVCSFLPWTGDAGSRTTNAWQGSVIWPVVVCVALAAALSWSVTRRRAVRTAGAVVEVGAAISALAYAAVEPVTRVDPPGYLGIGLIVSLALLLAGDGLRDRSSTVQVLLAVGGGVLVALCALPWARGRLGDEDGLSPWNASVVWTVTVTVVLVAVLAVLVRDSRSTRLFVALPTAICAGWALAFALAQPYGGPGRVQPSTVAIAKFTAGPRLVVGPSGISGVLEYALVGCTVMVALAVVLLVAAVAAVRTDAVRAR